MNENRSQEKGQARTLTSMWGGAHTPHAGLMAREFVVHEATGDAQVRCVAVRPSHVLHAVRAAASKKLLKLRGDVARALRDMPVSQWDAVRPPAH